MAKKRSKAKFRCTKCHVNFSGPTKIGDHFQDNPSHRTTAQQKLRGRTTKQSSLGLPTTRRATRKTKTQKFCTTCGNRRMPSHRFCGGCGAKI